MPVHWAVFTLIVACGGRRPPAAARGTGPTGCAKRRQTTRPRRLSPGSPSSRRRPPGEPDAKYAGVVLARVNELAVSRQITGIKSRLQRINPVTEQTGYNRMFGDLVALETRRGALLDRAA